MKFSTFLDSRKGGRTYNQDRVGLAYTSDSVILIVADGLGGHLHGEMASQIATDIITELFFQQAMPKIMHPNRFLVNAISTAHYAILDYAADRRLPEVPATTAVVVVLQDQQIYWSHVGDSRLYVFQNGHMLLKSRDHSVVQRLLDQGKIHQEEAKIHPERNKIYNCLGAIGGPSIQVGEHQFMQFGQSILLCTDGFWSQYTDEELVRNLNQREVSDVMPPLMDIAERRGGDTGDNLSAVAMTYLNHEFVGRFPERHDFSTHFLDTLAAPAHRILL